MSPSRGAKDHDLEDQNLAVEENPVMTETLEEERKHAEHLWLRLLSLGLHFDRLLALRARREALKRWARRNPAAAASISVVLAAFAVPFLCFLVFAVFTTAITICGFLIVEGFFLMLGVLFLTGSLMVVFMMLVGVAAGVAFGFAMLFGTRQVWGACSTNVCTWMAELKA